MTMETNDYFYWIELLNLDRNTWNYLLWFKLFLLGIVTWSNKSLLKDIIVSYLKPYNCLQIVGGRLEYFKPYDDVQTIDYFYLGMGTLCNIIVNKSFGWHSHTGCHTFCSVDRCYRIHRLHPGRRILSMSQIELFDIELATVVEGDSYYTKMERRVRLISLDCSTLPLIYTL